MKLAGKQIGILIALVLGVIILFLPAQDNAKYRFDPGALARSIDGTEDHIDPVTLSEWVIEGRRDYALIDIRGPEAFARGSIQGAENIPLKELLKRDTLDQISKDKLIVIYSNGNSHAAQAWLVMKTAGFDSYYLEGGYNLWNKRILNPKAPAADASDDEILRFKTRAAVSNYFGGRSSAGPGQDTAVKPKKKIIRRPRKKKKLKGC